MPTGPVRMFLVTEFVAPKAKSDNAVCAVEEPIWRVNCPLNEYWPRVGNAEKTLKRCRMYVAPNFSVCEPQVSVRTSSYWKDVDRLTSGNVELSPIT